MRTFLGLVLLTVAVVFLAVELSLLADPASARMSNDADPFGPPPPWYAPLFSFTLIALLGGAAAWLLDGGILGRVARGQSLTGKRIRR